MAEIEIERRPRRTGWTWFALILVLAAVAVGAWLVFNGGVEGGDAAPAAEQAPEVIEPLERPAQPYQPEATGAVPEEGAGGTTSPDEPVSSDATPPIDGA